MSCAATIDEEMDETTWDRRHGIVADTFEQLTYRPGARIALWGVSVTVTETVPCAVTGAPVEMCWSDEDQGDQLHTQIADPSISDADLIELACRAALHAAVNNDLHELAEWFTLDGHRVYDPHPNGGRFEPLPFTARLHFDGDPPHPANQQPGTDTHQLVEVPAARARAVAAELCERVAVGGPTAGRFEVWGDRLTHLATYPARDTGKLAEWPWSREWLADYTIADTGNYAAALRSAIVADMFTLAAQSAVHEALEWLRLDGNRIWDPHPPLFEGSTHLAQRDAVTLHLTYRSAPVVPRTAR